MKSHKSQQCSLLPVSTFRCDNRIEFLQCDRFLRLLFATLQEGPNLSVVKIVVRVRTLDKSDLYRRLEEVNVHAKLELYWASCFGRMHGQLSCALLGLVRVLIILPREVSDRCSVGREKPRLIEGEGY